MFVLQCSKCVRIRKTLHSKNHLFVNVSPYKRWRCFCIFDEHDFHLVFLGRVRLWSKFSKCVWFRIMNFKTFHSLKNFCLQKIRLRFTLLRENDNFCSFSACPKLMLLNEEFHNGSDYEFKILKGAKFLLLKFYSRSEFNLKHSQRFRFGNQKFKTGQKMNKRFALKKLRFELRYSVKTTPFIVALFFRNAWFRNEKVKNASIFQGKIPLDRVKIWSEKFERCRNSKKSLHSKDHVMINFDPWKHF